MKKLYRITTKFDVVFYVIASDPTTAVAELAKAPDVGCIETTVATIDILATERNYENGEMLIL